MRKIYRLKFAMVRRKRYCGTGWEEKGGTLTVERIVAVTEKESLQFGGRGGGGISRFWVKGQPPFVRQVFFFLFFLFTPGRGQNEN